MAPRMPPRAATAVAQGSQLNSSSMHWLESRQERRPELVREISNSLLVSLLVGRSPSLLGWRPLLLETKKREKEERHLAEPSHASRSSNWMRTAEWAQSDIAHPGHKRSDRAVVRSSVRHTGPNG